jgi:hypothetical protein
MQKREEKNTELGRRDGAYLMIPGCPKIAVVAPLAVVNSEKANTVKIGLSTLNPNFW